MNGRTVHTADPAGLELHGAEEGDVEKVFQHFFSQRNLFSTLPHNVWSPPTDVYETPDAYVIRVEIPGVSREGDLHIELNHNVLTVRGHRQDHANDTKVGFHQMEIHYGYFEKVVTLPHAIDPDVEPARYSDGFLCIRIKKSEPRRGVRCSIRIQT
jgi:HSP20 family protein